LARRFTARRLSEFAGKMTLKVLVIDDHPLVQEGVSAALGSLADDVTVMAARDAEQGLATAAENPDLDLVLLDLALPGMSGFNLIGKLHERLPSLPVVVLSALEEPENVRHAINAGAMGFVPKSAATRVLIEVLQQVLEGNVTVPLALQSSGPPVSHALPGEPGEAPAVSELDVALLTLRQLEVLSRMCQGKTNKQIATELGLSEKTIKAHVTGIFKVLGVVNRTQAVLVARRVGMIAS
jgi:two-component system, NarL family, nitrate/nitrite response regulator NarL